MNNQIPRSNTNRSGFFRDRKRSIEIHFQSDGISSQISDGCDERADTITDVIDKIAPESGADPGAGGVCPLFHREKINEI